MGAGFAVGGYCPGTSVVGMMSGRIDAAIFLIGLLLGTVIFAGIYPSIEALTTLGEFAKADAIPEALHVSSFSVNVVMVFAAVGVFLLGSCMEKKSSGPVSSNSN